MKRVGKRCVGLDVGKKTYAAAFMDGKGKVVMSNGVTYPEGRLKLYKQLRPSDSVVLEAGGIAFVMAKEIEKAVGCEVLVLHAGKLALIYGSMKKTDKEDALKLARIGMTIPKEALPVVAVPSDEEEERRSTVSAYEKCRRDRSADINRLHSLFVQQGITTVVKKDLKTAKQREAAITPLTGIRHDEAEYLVERIALTDKRLEQLSGRMKEAESDEDIKLLETIPGIGSTTAYAFTAHVKAERFEKGSQVSNYLGLVPKVDISGSIVKYGRITKRGNGYVRGLLNQASWALISSKNGGALKERFEYMTRKKGLGKKKAIVAVSRRLAELMWVMLKTRKEYEARRLKINGKTVESRTDLAERLAREAA